MALSAGLPALLKAGQVAGTLSAGRRRRVLVEVLGVTALMALGLGLLDALSMPGSWLLPWAGALGALLFVALPLIVGRWSRLEGDVLGIGRGALLSPILLGLAAALLVSLPFLFGFDLLQVQVLERSRGAGPGPLNYGLDQLLTQFVMVAFPEEVFFRGYVLGRLRAIWVPRWRLWGVPFGRAHLLSAALFALIHLVVVPAPHRLLVFFPGLLFCWIAERARSTVASTVLHALSNVMMQMARLFYG